MTPGAFLFPWNLCILAARYYCRVIQVVEGFALRWVLIEADTRSWLLLPLFVQTSGIDPDSGYSYRL